MLSGDGGLAQRRVAARRITRSASLLSGLLGVATGVCAFVPGFGIITGFLFSRFVESRLADRITGNMCEGLVRIYLPESEDMAEIADLLGNRRDPNRTGRLVRAVDAFGSSVMNVMRDLESKALVSTLELLAKILFPFGIGSVLGFAINYWETHRLGRWSRDRLEVLAGVPEDERERYVDRSGWCGLMLVVTVLSALVLAVLLVVLVVRFISSLI